MTTDTVDPSTLDPWEQHPDESPQAFESFCAYRDQPRADRSLRRAAKDTGRDSAQVSRWSSKHGWVTRVTAYDRHQDAISRRNREDELASMARRQASQLQGAATALMAPVQELLKRISDARATDQDPFAGMSTPQLARLAATAGRHVPSIVEAERLVAGLSTENIAGAPASVEEMRREVETMSRGDLESYLLGVDDGMRMAERSDARGALEGLQEGP